MNSATCTVKCITKMCGGEVKPLKYAKWRANQYCRFIASWCENCLMKYWIVDREGRYHTKDRKNNSKFDQRKDKR